MFDKVKLAQDLAAIPIHFVDHLPPEIKAALPQLYAAVADELEREFTSSPTEIPDPTHAVAHGIGNFLGQFESDTLERKILYAAGKDWLLVILDATRKDFLNILHARMLMRMHQSLQAVINASMF